MKHNSEWINGKSNKNEKIKSNSDISGGYIESRNI
jgi:hypothetical protein